MIIYNLANFNYRGETKTYRIINIYTTEGKVFDRVRYYKIRYENVVTKEVNFGYLHINPKLNRWGFYDKHGDWIGRKTNLIAS